MPGRAEALLTAFAALLWGTPLVLLLTGGGLFFLLHSRALPYRHLRHGPDILLGRYDDPTSAGDVPHNQSRSRSRWAGRVRSSGCG